MTSRSLFFKLLKEEWKRNLWAFGLAFLAFFFAMPVNGAMSISNLQQKYGRWIANGTDNIDVRYAMQLEEILETTVGLANAMNATAICAVSIVLALTGFMYLHSKKQVDFYHSIPVRRETIFVVRYLSGFSIVASMYLVNLVIATGILAVNGLELHDLLKIGSIAFLIHMTGFLINYGLMIIAVLLTGNFFLSVLGGIVLFAYVPAVLALVQGLMYLFYMTISYRSMDMEQMMVNGSPISYYIAAVVEGAGMAGNKYVELLDSAGWMLFTGMIMAGIALFLHKKRPSESAGNAMAFRVTKAPIKILLVVPITIASSMMFWNIYYSFAWAVFGFVIGLLITHCIIEILYHFEFAKLFSNISHMAISAVLALAVIAIFRFDLLGYDSYKPDQKDYVSASVYAANIQGNHNAGFPYEYENDGATHTSWRYVSINDFSSENMQFTDYETLMALADAGIAYAKDEKEHKIANESMDTRGAGFWTQLEVGYHLANGKTKHRTYQINVTELRDQIDRMYENIEYKKGTIPVLSYAEEQITGVYECHESDIREVTLSKEQREALLSVYQEELAALTLDERAEHAPVTSLRFLTIAEHDYICSISKQNHPNFTGDFRLEDMEYVNFFPVYPSFKQTLQMLEEAGICDLGPMDAEEVLRIEIISDLYTDKDAYYDAPTSYYQERVDVMVDKVTEPYPATVAAEYGVRTIHLENDGTKESLSVIQSVMDDVINERMFELNGLQTIDYGIHVNVYRKDINEDRTSGNQEFFRYRFPADRIPEFVKEAFHYEDQETKNINYGLNIPIEK